LELVSWVEARRFIEKLNQLEKTNAFRSAARGHIYHRVSAGNLGLRLSTPVSTGP
jgi:hypothetical protein